MYKRKIYKKLLDWKKRNETGKKTALFLKGPRQVGKTTIVKEFAKNEYENVVYINFMYEDIYNKCFDANLDVDTVISKLSLIGDFKFIPYKTVIIFDEIQECARARSSIKPFCEDGRFDVIATGSLLGVSGYNRNKNASIPVGFETHLTMHPMDFKEFLLAKGFNEDILTKIEDDALKGRKIDDFYHNVLFDELKWYLLIGGMPRVVEIFLETKNYNEARKEQQSIVSSYRNDFGKYLNAQEKESINNKDKLKLNKVFDSIPIQLAKIEKPDEKNSSTKFRFKDIEEGAKFREYSDTIDWLNESGITSICYNTTEVSSPINAYRQENQFKLFMNDTGLLLSMLSGDIISKLTNGSFNTYKGYIFENLVADALSKNDVPLYYNGDDKHEIDFILPTFNGLVIIEVKSGRASSNSFNKMCANRKLDIKGIKLSHNNVGIMNNILTLPYYFAYLIDENFEFPQVQ